MTATKAPYGLQSGRELGAGYTTGGNNVYRVDVSGSSGSQDIYSGDPVRLSAGRINLSNGSTDLVLGVARGFFWQDAVTKRPTWSQYIPAATSSLNGTGIYAYVEDDQRATFLVQADGSVSAGQLGMNAVLSGTGTGSSYTGQSKAVLKASSITTSAGFVRIMGLWEAPTNAWDDAYTIVEVRLNPGVTYDTVNSVA